MRSRWIMALGALLIALALWASLPHSREPGEPAVDPASPATTAPVTGVAPYATPSRPAPAAPPEAAPAATVLTREEARALQEEILAGGPTRAQLQKMKPAELHHQPAPVREVGVKLGALAEAIEANPDLAPEAVAFYEKCAGKDDFPSSVRALCYANYEKLGRRLRLNVREDAAPPEVRELADKLKAP